MGYTQLRLCPTVPRYRMCMLLYAKRGCSNLCCAREVWPVIAKQLLNSPHRHISLSSISISRSLPLLPPSSPSLSLPSPSPSPSRSRSLSLSFSLSVHIVNNVYTCSCGLSRKAPTRSEWRNTCKVWQSQNKFQLEQNLKVDCSDTNKSFGLENLDQFGTCQSSTM